MLMIEIYNQGFKNFLAFAKIQYKFVQTPKKIILIEMKFSSLSCTPTAARVDAAKLIIK